MLLKGKKAIVTGGAAGIGKQIVMTYLENGASVYFIDLNASQHLQEMEACAKENGCQVFFYQGNVADEEGITETINKILTESGGIDILVNNAGITRDNLVFRMSSSDWESVLKINLTSVFYISKVVARHMAKRKTGSIINMASIVGIGGNPGQTNYSASKAGLIGFTKSLGKEIAQKNVRVNAIAPGFIETEMTDKLSDQVMENYLNVIPLKRLGSPQDIANASLFLASDLSSYITARVIQVDGGILI